MNRFIEQALIFLNENERKRSLTTNSVKAYVHVTQDLATLIQLAYLAGLKEALDIAKDHESPDVKEDPIAEANVIGYRTARDQIVEAIIKKIGEENESL